MGHWTIRRRLKASDRDLVALYARLAAAPRSTRRRSVSLKIILAPRQRAADHDAYWKRVLDALVCAGMLLDDNWQYVELEPVEFDRGADRATSIILEDLEQAP
jgi:Holliday junction resolvase RusA-like endonuclease